MDKNSQKQSSYSPFTAEFLLYDQVVKSHIRSDNVLGKLDQSQDVIPQVSACSSCMDVQDEICASLGEPFGTICKSVPSPGRYKLCAETRVRRCGPFNIPCGIRISAGIEPC